MKKVINTSFIYLILGLISGVFYREFTKLYESITHSVLADLHVHFLVLGMMFFLIVLIMLKVSDLEQNVWFIRFFIVYNIAFPLMMIMMCVRGVLQTMQIEVSTGVNGMIAGIAGLSHIGMLVAFLCFFKAVRIAFMK